MVIWLRSFVNNYSFKQLFQRQIICIVIWFQVFLSNTNNLHTIIWLQVFQMINNNIICKQLQLQATIPCTNNLHIIILFQLFQLIIIILCKQL